MEFYAAIAIDRHWNRRDMEFAPAITVAQLGANARHTAVVVQTGARVTSSPSRYQNTTAPGSLGETQSKTGAQTLASIQATSSDVDFTTHALPRQPTEQISIVGEQPRDLEIISDGVEVAQVASNADAAPPQPQTGAGTKYVWRPREAISELIPGFQLGRWEGRLEGYLDYSRIDTENPSSQLRNENRLYDARVTLRNRGAYVIDPRLLRLTLGGTVGVIRRDLDVTTPTLVLEDRNDGDVLGYDFLAELLPINSFSVDLFANRDKLTEGGTLAGPLLTDYRNAGVTVRARRLYIPSTLSYRMDRAESESGTADLVTSRRDERRHSLTYDGRRGWLNRALRLRYRFIDRSDKFTPTTDFQTHEGRVFYTQDFGPELRKRWDSNIRIIDRSGLSEETRFDLDQLVNIDHSDRLRTQYRYVSSFTDRPVGDTDTNTLSFLLDHQLYNSLRTTLELNASRDDFPGGKTDIGRSRLEFDYIKRLPSAQLLANLTLFKVREDNDFETARRFVSQEPHRFDRTFALPVSLDQPLVEPGSVSVIKTQNGPDVPGCVRFSVPRPLVEGVDYTLRTVGALTEIVPLPCSLANPGINPADLITVDYRFVSDPSAEIDTAGYTFDLAIDQGLLRPFYRREKTDQDLVSGFNPEIIDDRDKEVFGIDIRHETEKILTQLRAQHEQVESRDQDYEANSALLSLRYNISRQWRLTLNGRLRETDFSQPRDRQVDLWAVRALLAYVHDANLRVEFFGEERDLQDTLVPDERFEEIGVRARWRLGKLDVRPTLRYIERRRGETDLRDHRAILRVIRRF